MGDALDLGSANGPPGSGLLVPVAIDKENAVVAVQFVLTYPESHVESGPPVVSSESSDHRAQSSDDLEGSRQVVVFSPTNAELPPDFAVSLPVTLLPNSPTGGPSLEISRIVFSDANGNTFPAAARYSLVETWRKANFPEDQRKIPAVIGDDRDPDGDGTPNIGELARGTDPNNPDIDTFPRSEIEVGEDGKLYLSLRFLQAADPSIRDAAPNVLESSRDLENWTGENVQASATGAATATSEEVEALVEIDTDARRFVRVRSMRAAGQ